MITILTLLLGALYIIGMSALAICLHIRRPAQRPDYKPTVSIVIAARNEQEHIRSCLESIAQLTYPRNLLEVVVVNDHSTDATSEVVRQFSTAYPHFRLLESPAPQLRLHGKPNALAHGIEESGGEIILFTDADCVVPPTWVENMVKYYAEEQIGIVAGFLSLRSGNLLESIQAIDWCMLLSAASATARLDFPSTAVGNNFSVRRSAYDVVGGFRSIPFSVTEDLALFRAVTQTAGMKAVIPLDAATVVQTEPCRTWKEVFAQRKRWFVGGRDASAGRILVFTIAQLFSLSVLLGPLFLNISVWAVLLAAKTVVDYILARPGLKLLEKTTRTWHWLLFQVYFMFYVALLPLLAILRPGLIWKERVFEPGSNFEKTDRPSPNRSKKA